MASYNKMTIIGNLGGDPETRYTPSGAPVTSFNVAVNERRRQQDGQTQESTQWFRVSCFNKLADVASQYLKKGSNVYIEGPLQVREFTGNDGKTRFSLDIRAREMQMLGSRMPAGSEEAEGEPVSAAASAPRASAPRGGGRGMDAEPAGGDNTIDDIPF
ncbi:MAG: single-stranded DNA-binding protein [Chloroflexota bacterium]